VTSEQKLEHYEAALRRIVEWADSYPARTGRRPDLLKVIAVLQGADISFDRVVAEIGRSITEQVSQIAREALKTGA
jgi:hypothetical protein